MSLTFNRLIREKSPYLLQHARNPVDWYPWGAEAFMQARMQNKPIFLSVGYASCHWCHVMERESFENETIAQLLNHYFIPVKVDREERPDIDEIYMNAVQLVSQRGGWPMSVFMTPDGEPFYAGTYYPPEIFNRVIQQLGEDWRNRKPEILASAQELTAAVRQIAGKLNMEVQSEPNSDILSLYLAQLVATYDEQFGGFGDAPKFPPNTALPVLLWLGDALNQEAAGATALLTLYQMARGGIHDQVGGGFHRYSTDAMWLLPHFEKMLYDNAQLAWAYTEAYRLTSDPDFQHVARRTLDWAIREMQMPEGGFASAIDADSEGEEGKYYTWSDDEIHAVLEPETAELFCRIYNIQPGGNFADEATQQPTGRNIPHLLAYSEEDIDQLPSYIEQLQPALETLLTARLNRVAPQRDDKVLAGWNGLIIHALARASETLEEPTYLQAAERAAGFIWNQMRDSQGRLLRRYRDGEAGIPAFLEDYALLGHGLLSLYEASGDTQWLDSACALSDQMIALFWDEQAKGFFATGTHHETMIARLKDVFDKSLPSGNGAAAWLLARLALVKTMDAEDEQGMNYEMYARETLSALWGLVERAPHMCDTLMRALIELDGEELDELPPLPMMPTMPNAGTDQEGPVYVQLAPDQRGLVVHFSIEEGWHIYGSQAQGEEAVPTHVSAFTDLPFSFGEPMWSDPQEIELGGDKLTIYQKEALVLIPVQMSGNTDQLQGEIMVQVTYQPCNQTECLAPVSQRFTLPVRLQAE